MKKWFDANGTDVDAYPDLAFRGGIYEGGILGRKNNETKNEIKETQEKQQRNEKKAR